MKLQANDLELTVPSHYYNEPKHPCQAVHPFATLGLEQEKMNSLQ
jgi:hypothetical protein